MTQLRKPFLLVVVFFVSNVSAFAFPEYLMAFQSDPFRNQQVNGCGTCHLNPAGGDDRNPFGQAFEKAGAQITPMVRAQFPDNFVYPIAKVNDTLTIYFSDPDKKQVVIETGGKKTLVDLEKKAIDGKEVAPPGGAAAAAPAQPPATPSPAARPAASPSPGGPPPAAASPPRREVSEVRVDEYAREGAFFGQNVVNLPNGKPQRAGGVDFFIGHRFTKPICLHDCKPNVSGPGELFGFDSRAIVGYGVRVGLTNHMSVAMFRSNLEQTIEFNSSFQVARQRGAVPLTFQVRAGIEGRNNFQERYSPYIQLVTVRTFMDRVSFVFAPTFAFNTRNENTFLPPSLVFGSEHNHTASLGIGTGIRLLPSASLVGEYIPRLHGFKGEFKDRPGVSIGLQKSTFRHTFELIITRQEPMTTAQYAAQGTDTFRVGFNIYRKLR